MQLITCLMPEVCICLRLILLPDACATDVAVTKMRRGIQDLETMKVGNLRRGNFYSLQCWGPNCVITVHGGWSREWTVVSTPYCP